MHHLEGRAALDYHHVQMIQQNSAFVCTLPNQHGPCLKAGVSLFCVSVLNHFLGMLKVRTSSVSDNLYFFGCSASTVTGHVCYSWGSCLLYNLT